MKKQKELEVDVEFVKQKLLTKINDLIAEMKSLNNLQLQTGAVEQLSRAYNYLNVYEVGDDFSE